MIEIHPRRQRLDLTAWMRLTHAFAERMLPARDALSFAEAGPWPDAGTVTDAVHAP